MADIDLQTVVNDPYEAIRALLQAPPEGMPPVVIELLQSLQSQALGGQAVGEAGVGDLPPYLFIDLVEQAPVAVSITDAKANILYVNRAFEILTRYSRKDIAGENESILSNKATPVEVYQELWKTITGKQTWVGTLVNRRKDGESYVAELTISPVLNRQGEITNFLGMHRDVTDLHRLRRELTYHKELIESVLNAAPVIVALVDSRGRVILDNHEYKKLYGDLRGREPADVLVKALAEQAKLSLDTQREKAENFKDIEVRLDISPTRGPRWFSCSGTWVKPNDMSAAAYFNRAPGDQVNLLLLVNETTQQRRERDRARIQHLRATLEETQRLSGMREALAAASFQVQKPLNLVNAAAAMLSRTDNPDAGLSSILEQIAESAGHALEVLKGAAPNTSQEVQMPVNLNEVIHDVLELSTESFLKEGIVVEWIPSPVLPSLLGQATSLRTLLKVLIDNAVHALSESRQADRMIRISAQQKAQDLVLEVQDNGPGIPADKRLSVFEPLYSGWKRRSGAGMGLSLAQEIANQHGGDIVVDAEVRDGCLLRVSFPLQETPWVR